MVKGRKLLDAAVVGYGGDLPRSLLSGLQLANAQLGPHEDVRAYCKWVENDVIFTSMRITDVQFDRLPGLPDSLRAQYCFAVLKTLHGLVEECEQEVTTEVIAPSQSLLQQNTPEGVIKRLCIMIGCLVEQ